MENISDLKTEQRHPDAIGIHRKSAAENLNIHFKFQQKTPDVVETQLSRLAEIIRASKEALDPEKGRIIGVGAGTSIRLLVQSLIEIQTHGFPRDRVEFIIPGGRSGLVTPRDEGEDSTEVPTERVRELNLGKGDILIGASASGRTPFVIGGLKEAKCRGAFTIAIANNPNSPIAEIADFDLLLETEPEPVGGSTRMNAGTAQKICLDLLMNGLMFELGYVSEDSVRQIIKHTSDFDFPEEKASEVTLEQLLDALLKHERQAIRSVEDCLENMEPAVKCMARQLGKKGGDLLVAGAGTTARAMVQEQAELFPTFGFYLSRTYYGILGGDKALLRDYNEMQTSLQEEEINKLLEEKFTHASDNDICLLGSVSGNTRYTNYLAERLRRLDVPTVGLTNSTKGQLKDLVDFPIVMKTSQNPGGKLTRLGAGTAHKVALNIMTTSAMTLMGHVYDGYMIDVKLFCEKLVQRAIKMIANVTGCDEEKARELLEATAEEKINWSVTKAVLIYYGVPSKETDYFIRTKGGGLSSQAIDEAKTLAGITLTRQ